MKQAPGERASARGLRLAILRSLFNRTVSDGLVDGAQQALAEMGAARGRVTVFDVPGAFELPVAAQAAALSGRFDAVIALGAVIRGETDHYEHVSREAAAGLAAVARETGVPVAFGVLTVREAAQAEARSRPGPGNKGREAAQAAVLLARTLRAIRGPGRRRRAGEGRR
ncbi:MAG TPA: 6,7-dimethyl-8-ribityllumazine synthase [Vicinamibacteria bacterium]|nr:6,7-dimethyl-8-ribityllumazine synthase [Vicinamibacteria bacterium]